jgi:gluconolactonase
MNALRLLVSWQLHLRCTLALCWLMTPTPAATAQELPLPPTAAEGAALTEVYAGEGFYEGPIWDPATGKLYFTGFFNNNSVLQVVRLDEPGKATVWEDESQGVNGTFLSLEGRMLGAQGMGKAIVDWSIGENGPEDKKSLYQNDTLNQPNDLCQTSDGRIYFTDPNFQTQVSGVYLLKDGEATKIIDNIPAPNGIMTSPDGRTLYISDSGDKFWRSYELDEAGLPRKEQVFFKPDTENQNSPDGMTIDADGNLYFAGRGGIWMVSPQGKALGFVPIPEFCSNVAFGGEDGKTLYMTCAGKLYSLQMTVTGAKR